MKIGNNNAPAPTLAPGAVAPARTSASGTGEAAEAVAASGKPEVKLQGSGNAESGSATVKLSATASSLLSGSHAEFNAEKVEKMRQAIADGSFAVNPGAIADKLIANAQELLRK